MNYRDFPCQSGQQKEYSTSFPRFVVFRLQRYEKKFNLPNKLKIRFLRGYSYETVVDDFVFVYNGVCEWFCSTI